MKENRTNNFNPSKNINIKSSYSFTDELKFKKLNVDKLQTEIKSYELTYNKQLDGYTYKGILYSGYVVGTNYNGLKYKDYYKNGWLNGKSYTYHKNGNIKSEQSLKVGRLVNDESVEKLFIDNKLVYVGRYFGDVVREGEAKEWDEEGNLIFDGKYKLEPLNKNEKLDIEIGDFLPGEAYIKDNVLYKKEWGISYPIEIFSVKYDHLIGGRVYFTSMDSNSLFYFHINPIEYRLVTDQEIEKFRLFDESYYIYSIKEVYKKDEISYKLNNINEKWFVLSGYLEDGRIFYEKTYYGKGISTFKIIYPRSRKNEMSKYLDEMLSTINIKY